MVMILAFDVGNTTTVLGVLDGTRVTLSWRITTRERTRDEYSLLISSLMTKAGVDGAGLGMAGISSVVPSETAPIAAAVGAETGVEVRRVDWRLDCGVTIATDNPAEVGGDRIANSVGVYYEHGGPAIVVDMGTAITYDFVTADGEYRGGVIAPGMVSGARELWERARMLPEVELGPPERVIGTNTVDAMRSGIVYGAAGQIEGIVRRMWEETGSRCRVVVTGGHCELVRNELPFEALFEPDLTLKGIAYAVDPGLRLSSRQ
jgi:type III pantothenate kinase